MPGSTPNGCLPSRARQIDRLTIPSGVKFDTSAAEAEAQSLKQADDQRFDQIAHGEAGTSVAKDDSDG
jgi:hypothetical protein